MSHTPTNSNDFMSKEQLENDFVANIQQSWVEVLEKQFADKNAVTDFLFVN